MLVKLAPKLIVLGIGLLPSVVGCSPAADSKPPSKPRTAPRELRTADRPATPPTKQPATPSADPLVVIDTSEGKVTVRLDRRHAPYTVMNFLKHCEQGHYNGTIFHQVIDGCMVLGGAFTADLREKPIWHTIPNEAANGLKNRRGTIAMARPLENPDGATSQFFFNLADNEQFDYAGPTADGFGYCVFGEVIEGMDVLDRIANIEVSTQGEFELLPVRTVVIQSARELR